MNNSNTGVGDLVLTHLVTEKALEMTLMSAGKYLSCMEEKEDWEQRAPLLQ